LAARRGEVPHRGGNGAARLGHARHLPDALIGITHPGNDKRAHRRIERAAFPRQRLGDALAHVSARDTCLAGSGELWRGIDGGDVLLAHAPGELDGQGTRAAADVENPHAGTHAGGIAELTRQPRCIAAHETVVVLNRRRELGHRATQPDGGRVRQPSRRVEACLP